MADLRDCFRFRSEAALAFRKLTRGSPGGQPTHRKSLCLGICAKRDKGMKWIGILLVSPLWGALSAQLFLQAWLGVANFFINLFGFVKGTVPRKTTAIAMGVAISSMILCFLLLRAGSWLLTEVLPFGRTETENVVYWLFSGLYALFMLPQIPIKCRKSWRNATIPGSLEVDSFKRALGLNPEYE